MSSFSFSRRALFLSSRPRMQSLIDCIILPTASGSRAAGGCSQNRPSLGSNWSLSFSTVRISCMAKWWKCTNKIKCVCVRRVYQTTNKCCTLNWIEITHGLLESWGTFSALTALIHYMEHTLAQKTTRIDAKTENGVIQAFHGTLIKTLQTNCLE